MKYNIYQPGMKLRPRQPKSGRTGGRMDAPTLNRMCNSYVELTEQAE